MKAEYDPYQLQTGNLRTYIDALVKPSCSDTSHGSIRNRKRKYTTNVSTHNNKYTQNDTHQTKTKKKSRSTDRSRVTPSSISTSHGTIRDGKRNSAPNAFTEQNASPQSNAKPKAAPRTNANNASPKSNAKPTAALQTNANNTSPQSNAKPKAPPQTNANNASPKSNAKPNAAPQTNANNTSPQSNAKPKAPPQTNANNASPKINVNAKPSAAPQTNANNTSPQSNAKPKAPPQTNTKPKAVYSNQLPPLTPIKDENTGKSLHTSAKAAIVSPGNANNPQAYIHKQIKWRLMSLSTSIEKYLLTLSRERKISVLNLTILLTDNFRKTIVEIQEAAYIATLRNTDLMSSQKLDNLILRFRSEKAIFESTK
jgi:hypothetical protein